MKKKKPVIKVLHIENLKTQKQTIESERNPTTFRMQTYKHLRG